MHFQESLRGRIAINGWRQVFSTIAPSGMKYGLSICVLFTILGLLAATKAKKAVHWGTFGLIMIASFSLGWVMGVFANLMGRSLRLYGEGGIGLKETSSDGSHWSVEEIDSIKITDLPKNRLVFEIEFVNAEKHRPLQFITTCAPEKREDMERGLEALAAAKRGNQDANGNTVPAWHTDESDQAIIVMYWLSRITIIASTILFSLMAALLALLAIVSGKTIIFAGAAIFALPLLPIPFMRWYFNTRIRPRYEEVMERRRALEESQ